MKVINKYQNIDIGDTPCRFLWQKNDVIDKVCCELMEKIKFRNVDSYCGNCEHYRGEWAGCEYFDFQLGKYSCTHLRGENHVCDLYERRK